jgi:hypothetical protein
VRFPAGARQIARQSVIARYELQEELEVARLPLDGIPSKQSV